jgi:hypothetical protein
MRGLAKSTNEPMLPLRRRRIRYSQRKSTHVHSMLQVMFNARSIC